MHIAALSSVPSVRPIGLKEKVDRNLRQFATPFLLQRQLYLLPPGHIPKEMQTGPNRKVKKIEPAILNEMAHEKLSLPDKISVLIRSIGFRKTCEVLDEAAASLNPEEQGERMRQFKEEVDEWTDGIVTCHQMNSLRALRMLLFAALENCWRLEDQKGKENVLALRTAFQASFLLIERFSSFPDKIPFVLQGLFKNLDSLAAYRNQETKGKKIQEYVEQMEQILKILQKGFDDPVHLMPFFFHPLKTQPVTGEEVTDLVDYLGPKVSEWLTAFQRSFCFQSEPFPKLLKEKLESKKLYRSNIGDYQAAEAVYNDLVARSQNILNGLHSLLNDLQAYQKLTPARQRERVGTLTRMEAATARLTEQIYKFKDCNGDCRNKMEPLIQLCQGTERFETEDGVVDRNLTDWLEDQYLMSIHHPLNHCMVLFSYTNSSIQNSCKKYTSTFPALKDLLPPQFKTLPHVTVADLLSWQLEESTLTLLDKINRKQIPEDEHLVQNLQTFQNNLQAVFNAMRRYYVLRRYTQGRSLEDLDLDVQCHNKLAENIKAAQQMLSQKQHPEVSKALDHFVKVSQLLASLLTFERWPEILVSSPFASENEDPKLEEEFHSAQLATLRRSFLECKPPDLWQGLMQTISNKPFHQDEMPYLEEVKTATGKIVKALETAQTELQQARKPTFLQEARHFWKTLTICQEAIENALEPAQVRLDQYCEQNPKHFPVIKELLTSYIPRIQDFLQALLFTPGQSLLAYVQVQELIEEEARGQELRAQALELRRVTREKRLAAASQKKAPEHTPEAAAASSTSIKPAAKPVFDGPIPRFRHLCRMMSDRCRSFQMANAKPEQIQNNSRQHEYASNLLRNLQTLEELFAASEHEKRRPFVLLETAERLSLALEQSGKLACASLNLPETVEDQPEPILHRLGKECFWHAHSPLRLTAPVDKDSFLKKKKFLFSKEERDLMQSLERVAAVTYRNPASGRDLLTQALTTGESDPKLLREGITICGNLLQHVVSGSIQVTEEPSLAESPLARCLSPTTQVDKALLPRADEQIQRCLERLARIKRHRSVALNRHVAPIYRGDESHKRRVGTINAALKDLALNFDICEDLLFGPESPTLALAETEAALSRQGAILEEALLILLSHLPCPENPGSRQHCLWAGKKPLRYTHDISEYSRRLREALPAAGVKRDGTFYDKLQAMADGLAPYLQQRHRYVTPACKEGDVRDKVADLSSLRRRIGCLSPAEMARLGRQPEEQMQAIDSQLRQVLLSEVKGPLVQTIEIVEQLLAIYEELNRALPV